jgi:hypothetical protein
MAITQKYTLVCDDIRQENNGKFIILGLYTPDIIVPMIPFALPSIGFFVAIRASEDTTPGVVDFSFRLTQGDTVLSGGSGKMQIQKGGDAVIPLRLGGLRLVAAAPCRFLLDIEGAGEQIVHEFQILLRQSSVPQTPAAKGTH